MRQEVDRPWEWLEVSVSFPPVPIVQPFPVPSKKGVGRGPESVSVLPSRARQSARACVHTLTQGCLVLVLVQLVKGRKCSALSPAAEGPEGLCGPGPSGSLGGKGGEELKDPELLTWSWSALACGQALVAGLLSLCLWVCLVCQTGPPPPAPPSATTAPAAVFGA